MKTRLENQIAIVTGSSSGNGRAIALALSSSGATVICADLNKQRQMKRNQVEPCRFSDELIILCPSRAAAG
jgi:NAD(P)-dependent dehydrogenase (short-subunit alcohol dehydrogenase family)